MSIARKKTTTTTIEEEYDNSPQLDDGILSNSNRDSLYTGTANDLEKATKTGEQPLPDSDTSTTQGQTSEKTDIVGRTIGDFLYTTFQQNNLWTELIFLSLIYIIVFYITMKNYSQCDLLTPSKLEWIVVPLSIATAITIIYFILRWIIVKIRK